MNNKHRNPGGFICRNNVHCPHHWAMTARVAARNTVATMSGSPILSLQKNKTSEVFDAGSDLFL